MNEPIEAQSGHDSSPNLGPQSQIKEEFANRLAQEVSRVAGVMGQRNVENSLAFDRVSPQSFRTQDLIPFIEDPRCAFVPVNGKVISEKIIPGYKQPSEEVVAKHVAYAKEHYGAIPGEAGAFIACVAEALQPTNVFVFGTGRGRIEQIILESSPGSEIATIDIPDELLEVGTGKPDKNNARYRDGLKVTNETIGDLVRDSRQVHQLRGDSFELEPANLCKQVQMVVVDANHLMPSVLHDAANALLMADTENGAVILFDDCRKGTPFNASVEAAVGLASQSTGVPVLMPTPSLEEMKAGEGLQAAMGMMVIAPGTDREELTKRANALKSMAKMLRDVEPL